MTKTSTCPLTAGLSPAQRKALDRIYTDGELFAGQGVNVRTIAALARAGLVRARFKIAYDKGVLGGVRRGSQHWDWGAYPQTSTRGAARTTGFFDERNRPLGNRR